MIRLSKISPILIWHDFCFVDKIKSVVHNLSVLTCTHQSSVHAVTLSAAFCILFVAVVTCSSTPKHKVTGKEQENSPAL